MRIVVTGAAGFIGSHLCEYFLRKGHHVIGIDGLVGAGSETVRNRNLKKSEWYPRFQLKKVNLLDTDWHPLLENVNAVFHLAGMPGVRTSWGKDFKQYVNHNILATQRLLEACRHHKQIEKLVYISTSSVYGETSGKTVEDQLPSPLSPYGVSKLTGESLCHVYHKAYGVPIVVLRYFTVYGPRQRPDMAFHRFIHQLFVGSPISVYGDGKQTRDFTYVADCVEATASVLNANQVIGETINIGGKERASVLDVIALLEDITGIKAVLEFQGESKGEPKQTWADIRKAENLLNYEPKTKLQDGLRKEVEDLTELYGREHQ
ncbi:MAG TPA: NAD-dependent epimerase/dehydratase family protein [Bacillales bacterium]|nr:NAD-dependent epimerase/dehydratase family protein [Bacillales bacterium]